MCSRLILLYATTLLLSLVPPFTEAHAMGTQSKRITVEEINANPTILNGQSLMQDRLEGLVLKNIMISNLTLQDIEAWRGTFENVTFENCQFIKVSFSESTFTNVAFKNCKILPIEESTHHSKISDFSNVVLNNVLFDSTDFKYAELMGIDAQGGFVLFKNVKQALPRGKAPFLSISNAQVRVLDSRFDGVIAGDENVNAITRNSKYINGGIYGDYNFIFASEMKDAQQVGGFKILVITGSTVDGDVGVRGGKGYLTDNTYLSGTRERRSGGTVTMGVGIHAHGNDTVYILAKNSEPCSFRLFGGILTLKGFTLVDTLIGGLMEKEPPITALNLQNVTLRGGRWQDLKLLGGKWENVRIEPSVLVDQTFVENVQVHRLEFPQGPPWKKEGEFTFKATESSSPFKWEEIKVPTPEEVGLVWWPAVEPGYQAKQ